MCYLFIILNLFLHLKYTANTTLCLFLIYSFSPVGQNKSIFTYIAMKQLQICYELLLVYSKMVVRIANKCTDNLARTCTKAHFTTQLFRQNYPRLFPVLFKTIPVLYLVLDFLNHSSTVVNYAQMVFISLSCTGQGQNPLGIYIDMKKNNANTLVSFVSKYPVSQMTWLSEYLVGCNITLARCQLCILSY